LFSCVEQNHLASNAPAGQTADEAIDEAGDWEEEESFDPAEDVTAIGEEPERRASVSKFFTLLRKD